MNRKAVTIAVIAAVALTALSMLIWWAQSSLLRQSSSAGGDGQTVASSGLATGVEPASVDNCYAVFRYRSEVRSELTLFGDQSDEQVITEGTLLLRRTGGEQAAMGGAVYLAVFEDLTIDGLKPDGAKQRLIREALQTPFMIELDARSLLKTVTVPDTSKETLEIAVGAIQHLWSTQATGQHRERAGGGYAQVSFTVPANASPVVKRRHQLMNLREQVRPGEDITQSRFEYTRGPAASCIGVTAISGEEERMFTSAEFSAKLVTKELLQAELVPGAQDRARAGLQYLPSTLTAWPSYGHREWAPAPLDPARLQQAIQQFLDELRRLETPAERMAWVAANLHLLDHLSELLISGQIDKDSSVKIFWALGEIDTARTVAILNDVLLNRQVENPDRFRALVALTSTETSLTPSQLEGISAYLDSSHRATDLDNSIAMSLGVVARSRFHTDPEQYEELEYRIIDQLQSSARNDRFLLNAARNLLDVASPAVAEAVMPALQSPDDRVRETAADALAQFSPLPELTEPLVRKLESETAAHVERNLVAALGRHGRGQAEAASVLLNMGAKESGKGDSIRRAAVAALVDNGFADTAAQKEQLNALLVGETDPDIVRRLTLAIYGDD